MQGGVGILSVVSQSGEGSQIENSRRRCCNDLNMERERDGAGRAGYRDCKLPLQIYTARYIIVMMACTYTRNACPVCCLYPLLNAPLTTCARVDLFRGFPIHHCYVCHCLVLPPRGVYCLPSTERVLAFLQVDGSRKHIATLLLKRLEKRQNIHFRTSTK